MSLYSPSKGPSRSHRLATARRQVLTRQSANEGYLREGATLAPGVGDSAGSGSGIAAPGLDRLHVERRRHCRAGVGRLHVERRQSSRSGVWSTPRGAEAELSYRVLVDSTWSPGCPPNEKTPETDEGSGSFPSRNGVYFLLPLGPDVDPALPPLADLPELPPVVAAPAAELLFLSLVVALVVAPSVWLMAALAASARC